MVGRPCVGKTALLIVIASRVHRRSRTNGVLATAQERGEALFALAPSALRRSMVSVGAQPGLASDPPVRPSNEPRLFLVEAFKGDLAGARFLAHCLQSNHPCGCGLLIENGWTVYSGGDTKARLRVGGATYRVPIEEGACRISVRSLRSSIEFARKSGVPVICGIRSASNKNQSRGPVPADLLHLQPLVRTHSIREVLLHRRKEEKRKQRRSMFSMRSAYVTTSASIRNSWPTY
jgi:hypothetical protein